MKNSEQKNSTFPKIGFGTWLFGGDVNRSLNNDDERDIDTIRYAINKGLTHIDTARSYADGKCEELVGKAIKGFKREDLFIATKVRPEDLAYDDLIKSCEGSLERLGVDYVDLFYVHAPNPEIPIKETAEALNELVSRGLIKNIGLSNVSIKTIEEYQKYTSVPIFAVQNHYNLIARESQVKGIVDYCEKNGIHFVAWRPVKFSFPGAKDPFYKNNVFPIIDEMAQKYGKTNAQIAAKWLTQQNGVSIIFKSSNRKHIDEIIDTENFELSKDDWEKLNKEFPLQKSTSFTAAKYFKVV